MVVDLGAGDGRWVYENARRAAEDLFIAIDPDATALSEYAFRASRKPARGGVANAVFVVASLEHLPAELNQMAALVRVNFPWGGLLRGLLRPEVASVKALAYLGQADSTFEVVLAYDPQHDIAALEGELLPSLDEDYIDSILTPAYSLAGLRVTARLRMTRADALELPSTWGRRLLHGRERDVFLITAMKESR